MNKQERQENNAHYLELLKTLKTQGLAESTIDSYSRAFVKLMLYFDTTPEKLTTTDFKDYFYHLIENKSWSTVNVRLNGVKFFWNFVLDKKIIWEKIIKPKQFRTLPDVISTQEVAKVINLFKITRYKVFFCRLHTGTSIK